MYVEVDKWSVAGRQKPKQKHGALRQYLKCGAQKDVAGTRSMFGAKIHGS